MIYLRRILLSALIALLLVSCASSGDSSHTHFQIKILEARVAKQQKCLDLIDQRLYELSEDLRKAQHGGSDFYIRPYEDFLYLSMGCSWLED